MKGWLCIWVKIALGNLKKFSAPVTDSLQSHNCGLLCVRVSFLSSRAGLALVPGLLGARNVGIEVRVNPYSKTTCVAVTPVLYYSLTHSVTMAIWCCLVCCYRVWVLYLLFLSYHPMHSYLPLGSVNVRCVCTSHTYVFSYTLAHTHLNG